MSAYWVTTVIVSLICVTAIGVCVFNFTRGGNGAHHHPVSNVTSVTASAHENRVNWSTPTRSGLEMTPSTETKLQHQRPQLGDPTTSSPSSTSTKHRRIRKRCAYLPNRRQYSPSESAEYDVTSDRRRQKPAENGDGFTSGRRRQKRIVNGDDVVPGQFPWVVMVWVKGEFMCGGTIIHSRHVLTAAHCLRLYPRPGKPTFYNASDVEVIAGRHAYVISCGLGRDLIREQRLPVKRVIPHDDYNDTKIVKYNDLAILELQNALKWTEWVAPVCLPSSRRVHPPRQATMLGWGSVRARLRLNWMPTPPVSLQQLRMKVRTRSTCIRELPFTYAKYMTEWQVCAVSLNASRVSSACNGDSGGPLFVRDRDGRYVQFGVLSWGYCRPVAGIPSFFTYVPPYVPWIRNVTG